MKTYKNTLKYLHLLTQDKIKCNVIESSGVIHIIP